MKQLVWVLVGAAVACGKGNDGGGAKAKPFEGPLTYDKVLAAKETAHPRQAWKPVFAKLQSMLGPPTKIDGKKYIWAAKDGEKCAYLTYDIDGDQVWIPGEPIDARPDGAWNTRFDCLVAAGDHGPPEGPSAAPPHEASPSYEVSQILDLAVRGRSKWSGKTIRVVAVVNGVQGGELVDLRDRADSTRSLYCKLDAGVPPPPFHHASDVLQGTVVLTEELKDGAITVTPSLSKCSPVALDCKSTVAEVNAYLALVERTGAKAPKPWPTGDDKTDAAIRAWIDDFTKRVAKPRASALAKATTDTVAPMLAGCPPAFAKYKEVNASDAGSPVARVQAVADTFAECDCKVDIPMWLARQYAALYVASGAALDKPLEY
jgi:hypothetical protein